MYTTRLLTTRLFTGTRLAHVLALGHLSADDDGNDTRDARDIIIMTHTLINKIYICRKFKLDLEKLRRVLAYLPTRGLRGEVHEKCSYLPPLICDI